MSDFTRTNVESTIGNFHSELISIMVCKIIKDAENKAWFAYMRNELSFNKELRPKQLYSRSEIRQEICCKMVEALLEMIENKKQQGKNIAVIASEIPSLQYEQVRLILNDLNYWNGKKIKLGDASGRLYRAIVDLNKYLPIAEQVCTSLNLDFFYKLYHDNTPFDF